MIAMDMRYTMIQDLQNREDLMLVTDSQDVKAILHCLGFDNRYYDDIQSLLVSVDNGEYVDVYC